MLPVFKIAHTKENFKKWNQTGQEITQNLQWHSRSYWFSAFFYNHLVERFQKRTQRYTAELVVGGVLVTVLVSGFFIGWTNAVKVLLLFGASGFFMIIGSWLRAARDDEQAKEITKGNGK